MKKAVILGLTLFVFVAFIGAPLSQAQCGGSKGKLPDCAKTCGLKTAKTTDKADKTQAGMISAEEKAKADAEMKAAGYEFANLNIKGMTCTGCEAMITKALSGQDGVVKVCAIDHKTGQATVCYDPAKVKSDGLISTITKAGYKTELVNTGNANMPPHKGACPPGCDKTCCTAKVSATEKKTTDM